MKTLTTAFALVSAMSLSPAVAHAQSAATFPAKPIRLIVPYPPGGGSDTIARPIAQRITESLKQQVVVDNRGGASGNIGMEMAAKAPPDGYTIVFALTARSSLATASPFPRCTALTRGCRSNSV